MLHLARREVYAAGFVRFAANPISQHMISSHTGPALNTSFGRISKGKDECFVRRRAVNLLAYWSRHVSKLMGEERHPKALADGKGGMKAASLGNETVPCIIAS